MSLKFIKDNKYIIITIIAIILILLKMFMNKELFTPSERKKALMASDIYKNSQRYKNSLYPKRK